MRIAINALSVYSGGGLVSMRNLLPALARERGIDECIVIVSKHQERVLQVIPKEFRTYTVALDPRNAYLRIVYEQVVLPFVLMSLKVDWLYSVGSMTSILAGCRVMLLIENPNPFLPYQVGWDIRGRIRNFLQREIARLSSARATSIRFLTENSRDIICRRLGIDRAKTFVLPHGVEQTSDQEVSTAEVETPKPPYVLCVSNIDPHKNMQVLLNAFEIIAEKYKYNGQLVIAGAPTYEPYFKRLLQLRDTLRSASRISFLGWIEPAVMPFLYRRADVVVMPSLAETFGIPVIEAMKHGAPVVASKIPAGNSNYFIPFREICGDAALYFDPFDPADLASKIHSVLSDPSVRSRQIAAGKERVKAYTWESTAKSMIDELKRIDNETSR
ncbi:MAG: glycosyltransferase family 1 protein [Ignavibacteriales bacterium]|nr:glycosyltransferase family 1 protein [Ignavibacteriales bacterium]